MSTDAKTLLERLQTLIRAAKHDGNTVFHSQSVRITGGIQHKALGRLQSPVCLIRPGDLTSDPDADEEPAYHRLRVSLTVAVVIPNDEVGEAAILGTSQEPGLLQIESALWTAVELLQREDNVPILNRAQSAALTEQDERNQSTAFREYRFEAEVKST